MKWGGGSWKSWEKIVIINHKKIEKCTHSSFRTSLITRFTKKPSRFQKVIEPKITTYMQRLKPTKNLNFYFLIYLFLKNSNNSVVSISLCELLWFLIGTKFKKFAGLDYYWYFLMFFFVNPTLGGRVCFPNKVRDKINLKFLDDP